MVKTIILVEDDPSINNVLTTMFELYGYKVVSFFDGYEALTYLNTTNDLLDFILSDVNMRVMCGDSLFLEIDKNVNLASIRRALMTGCNNYYNISEMVFRKPLSIDVLLDYVKSNKERTA